MFFRQRSPSRGVLDLCINKSPAKGNQLYSYKVDPQYWCIIVVVKLYFVLINKSMRNGNIIVKIFFLVIIHCGI